MNIEGMKHLWFLLAILTSILAISRSDDTPADCVYSFYIQTGQWWWIYPGTDSKISVAFFDKYGNGYEIENIETWGGKMGPGHDYFERGNLDIFSGKGKCVLDPICSLSLTSDGSGTDPGWYVNYLELTTTGDQKACGRQIFTLDKWLSSYTTYTVTQDNCARKAFATDDVIVRLPSVLDF